MSMEIVLDPTSCLADDVAEPGPDAGELRGKRVGIRLDMLWRSWDWVAEAWAERLRAEGAQVAFWRSCGRTGEEGRRAAEAYADFLAGADIAVVGLGNCGSCTSWTIADALLAAQRGLPTVAVATAQFEGLARALAARGGRSSLRLQLLPYPLDVLPRAEVEAIARARYDAFLQTLGVRSRSGARPAA